MITYKVVSHNTKYGRLKINLQKILYEKNISINQLSKMCDVKYDVVAKYYYNKMQYLSCDIISKFCYVLNCDVSDIIYHTHR